MLIADDESSFAAARALSDTERVALGGCPLHSTHIAVCTISSFEFGSWFEARSQWPNRLWLCGIDYCGVMITQAAPYLTVLCIATSGYTSPAFTGTSPSNQQMPGCCEGGQHPLLVLLQSGHALLSAALVVCGSVARQGPARCLSSK